MGKGIAIVLTLLVTVVIVNTVLGQSASAAQPQKKPAPGGTPGGSPGGSTQNGMCVVLPWQGAMPNAYSQVECQRRQGLWVPLPGPLIK